MPFRPLTAGSVTAPATGALEAGSVGTQLAALAAGATTTLTTFEDFPVPDATPTTVATFTGSGLYLLSGSAWADPPTSVFADLTLTGAITPVVDLPSGVLPVANGSWPYEINGTANFVIELSGGAANVTGWVSLIKVSEP